MYSLVLKMMKRQRRLNLKDRSKQALMQKQQMLIKPNKEDIITKKLNNDTWMVDLSPAPM